MSIPLFLLACLLSGALCQPVFYYTQHVEGLVSKQYNNFRGAIDGNIAVIGAPEANEAWVYSTTDGQTQFTYTATISTLQSSEGSGFGITVAVDSTQSVIVVGAPYQGFVSIFVQNSSSLSGWSETQHIQGDVQFFGASVDIQGDFVVIGAPGSSNVSGSVFVYKNQGHSWLKIAQLQADVPLVGDGFGTGVGLNDDGSGSFIVGAPGKQPGFAYIFQPTLDGSYKQSAKLQGSEGYGAFGHSVSLSGCFAAVSGGQNVNGTAEVCLFGSNAGDLGSWGILQAILTPNSEILSLSLRSTVMVFAVDVGPGSQEVIVYESANVSLTCDVPWFFATQTISPPSSSNQDFGEGLSVSNNGQELIIVDETGGYIYSPYVGSSANSMLGVSLCTCLLLTLCML